jgi:branched-chain amino acid transport system permease protein
MHTLVQGVILGVLTAGVLALMASGQTLIFGVMRVINLAQGAMVILSAYLAYQLFTSFGIDPFLAIPITTVVMFGVGVTAQLRFLRPLRPEDHSELSLLVTFAIALLIEGFISVVWGTNVRSINTSYTDGSWTLLGYQVPVVRFWAFLLSVFVLGLLGLLLSRSRLGRAIRATVQNRESATLLGVEAGRVSAVGFGIGTATAAAGGAVYGMVYPFNAGSHYDLISLLLSIIVLGGLGSIGGALVGAVVVATSSAIVATAFSPVWSSMTAFVILLLVLLLRPRGLFGTQARGAS